jgi:hypothetical protein
MLDVPDVELDPVVPGQRRTPLDLRPAREPGSHLEPFALTFRVPFDLVAERRPRADDGHLTADDVPQLGQLVDRRPTEDSPDARDPGVTAIDGEPGALPLCADDHRAELEDVEVAAVLPDAALPVDDRAAVLDLDRECRRGE